MKFCKSLLLIAALALVATGAQATNVVVNGDFETGNLDGWEVFGAGASSFVTIDAVNGPGAAGSFSALLDNQAMALGLGLKQATPVGYAAPGTVNYSFDLKLEQADVGGVFFVQIFAEAEGLGIVGGSGLLGPFWAWDWTTYTGTFEAPLGTNFMTIQFTATTGATEGSNCIAHLDNVVLEQPNIVAADETSLDSIKALYR